MYFNKINIHCRRDFESWTPDIGGVEKSTTGLLMVVVTSPGGQQGGYVDQDGCTYDFVSRCFAPWLGIPEDPVTGNRPIIMIS